MKHVPEEHVLQDAIQKLRDEDCEELVRYIGQFGCSAVWFEDREVVERVSHWVEERIHKAEGLASLPDFLLSGPPSSFSRLV